ncbi:hypothetical protein NU195Hw_g9227t1 [Hortaea werneckii]
MGATPSRTQGEALVPGPEQEIEGLPELQQQALQPVTLGPEKSSADPLSLSFSQKMAAAAHEAGNRSPKSSHTATGDTSKGSQLAHRHSQDDSQTRILNKYGLSGSSRTSWHAVNEGSSIPISSKTPAVETNDPTLTPGTIRNDPEDLTKGDNESKKGRRATPARKYAGSSRAQSDRSRAPISGVIDGARGLDPTTASHGYTESGSAQEGGTPFMFRKKRGSKSDLRSTDPVSKSDKSAQARKSVQSATSKGMSEAGTNAQEGDGEGRFPSPSQPSLKPKPSDSPANEPDLSLMEEHMNSKLPQEPGSTRRSSGVKRALRKSMEEAGATFDHVAVSPAASQAKTSPVPGELGPGTSALGTAARSSLACSEALEAQADRDRQAWQDSDTSDNDTGRTSLRGTAETARRETLSGSQEPWLGTQNMLYQAQRDLFISPEKPTGTPNLNLDESFASTAPPAESANRPPLRELSQENLPSTQAMMNAWSPWTAVKKPRAAQEPLPVAAGDSPLVPTPMSRPQNKSVSDLKQQNPTSRSAHGETGSKNRRSSLRFSSTNTESPAQTSRLDFSITKSSSAEEEPQQNPSPSANRPAPTAKPQNTPRASSQDLRPGFASTRDPSTLLPFQPSRVNNHTSSNETHHPLPRHAEGQSQATTTDAFPSFGDVTGFDVAREQGDLRYDEDDREMGGKMSQGSIDRAVEGLARDVLVRSTEEIREVWR